MKDNEHAIKNAQSWADTIMEWHRARQSLLSDELEGRDAKPVSVDGEEFDCADALQEWAQERPLSVQFRSGWVASESDMAPEEYEILLTTGGPACRILGDLGAYNSPSSARLQWQDWGTPWNDCGLDYDEDALIEFASMFYFGE